MKIFVKTLIIGNFYENYPSLKQNTIIIIL